MELNTYKFATDSFVIIYFKEVNNSRWRNSTYIKLYYRFENNKKRWMHDKNWVWIASGPRD